MLVTSLEGLKYSDGNLAWGRLPGSITKLAAKCQKTKRLKLPKRAKNSRDPVAAIEKNALAERHCICRCK
jgi:hypothetical protein